MSVTRVLAIGGNGFVGSHVVDALLAEGADVAVFDMAPERFRAPLPQVRYFHGCLGDDGALKQTLRHGFDVVVHLANATVPTSLSSPCDQDLKNVGDSVNLFRLCAEHGIKKIVFFSSGGTVYGVPQHLPIPEDAATNPISSYGIAKLATEKYLLCYARLHSIEPVILRLANPYGTRQSPFARQGVVPIFTWKLLQGEPITIWGDGSVIRDFVEVRDVARLSALASLEKCSGVFNVGSGQGTSVRQMLATIAKTVGIEPQVVYGSERQFDAPAVVLDCSRARQHLGWESQISLEQGLCDLAAWLKHGFTASAMGATVGK